ncbi:prepilin-type N-terminal cleavage/methylation domain-containing protein [Microbacterium sp. W4I4]|uniref:type IV pilus modification PilV family protein n=1 Tax=Microbacterium sp. W4I4 TaxID=3042295 RepID=UPI00278B8427|nr:prepilin-type N-terminal cleavage/methylation domain-containing protein [Microbacterium sp. W4I4]MDQ0614915.1 prepilin-type N-terminal cleavage/methylation domain-containing protein [Microbacterium sp. W4I4]
MSSHARPDDDGFGLIEAVIAMVLIAVIAMALAPLLINGLRYSSEQSTVATATRQLNSLVEQARESGDCAAITTAAASHSYPDGVGRDFDSSGVINGTCGPGKVIRLTLTAIQGGRQLAVADALFIVPALPETIP